MHFGAFNGTPVAVFKIQPMVATLILYTAGRSIAAWINNNELPMISDPAFAYYGNFLPGVAVPTPIFIAVICMLLAWALLRFTNIGLYSQAVGINASAARLNGIHPQFVKFLTYVILGLCVAVAGFIKVSRFSTINYSVVAKDIEMDAILAVALGGNALSGGKFNIWASVLGAYVIQFPARLQVRRGNLPSLDELADRTLKARGAQKAAQDRRKEGGRHPCGIKPTIRRSRAEAA